jgi:hypothetical protein
VIAVASAEAADTGDKLNGGSNSGKRHGDLSSRAGYRQDEANPGSSIGKGNVSEIKRVKTECQPEKQGLVDSG